MSALPRATWYDGLGVGGGSDRGEQGDDGTEGRGGTGGIPRVDLYVFAPNETDLRPELRGLDSAE